jgi:hypothetical protein
MFEIAYAAASNRLCLFTGTGFSKAITGNNAPSWQGLLEDLCSLHPQGDAIKESLFPGGNLGSLSLEEAAQVISLELDSIDKNVHEEVSKIISTIDLDGENKHISKYFTENNFRVITTNYDKLAERLAGEDRCQSIASGLPIPKSPAKVKVYHVHGSVDSPENMVITSEDYFKFINNNSYLSQKLSTVLHENTVVILGYSLGDTNLKAIMSECNGFSKSHLIGSNIFLVSRSSVGQHVKDYYTHCYGIRVIDNLGIPEFFEQLNIKTPKVANIVEASLLGVRAVINDGKTFKNAFLRLEDSFSQIISSITAEGLSLNDDRVVEVIGEIIDKKRSFTGESGAWEQYEHLARWLIYLGSIFEIKGSSIEKVYLDAVLRSMQTMSKKLIIGYSWHAYNSWENRWTSIMSPNRSLIKKHIEFNTSDLDALGIVCSL